MPELPGTPPPGAPLNRCEDRPRTQRAAAGRPMLTISDQPGFVDRGGMIEMKLVAGRTRFDINLAAARAAGLNLSSQLLQLAERVVQ